MTSFWPNVCHFVDEIEGLIGIFLNLIVIVVLWRKRLPENLVTYRVSITITSLQGVFYSITLALLGGVVHLSVADRFLCVFYGPVASFPPIFGRTLVPLSVFLAFTVWCIVPAACILQYFALSRFQFSNFRYCPTFLAGPQLQKQLINDVTRIHQLREDDKFAVYGVTLHGTRENTYSMTKLMVEGVLPTYFIAFLLFVVTTTAVRRKLTIPGIQLSKRTALMQRKFLTTLMLQGWLPLAVITVPLSIIGVGFLSGRDMGQFTVLFSFSFHLVPIIQALASLSFVLRGLPSPSSTAPRSNISRISSYESRQTRNTTITQ